MLVFGVTCNAGGVVVVTFTVAFALAEPLEPVQVMLYVVLNRDTSRRTTRSEARAGARGSIG